MKHEFEQIGWGPIDINAAAQQRVADSLQSAGARVETLNLTSIVTGCQAFKHLSEYESDYKSYNGPLEHCFLEKSLEHYLSLLLISPKPEMVGVDVGSCQSVLPSLGRRVYGVRYYEQDLEYTAGIKDDRIGSSADSIPLPDESVDFMTLHCTFEHFENNADTGFIKECARILKRGGEPLFFHYI